MGFVHNQTSSLPAVDSVRPIDYSVSDSRVVSLVFVLSVIMNTPEMVFLDTHGSWWNYLGVRGLYLTVGKRSVVSRTNNWGKNGFLEKKMLPPPSLTLVVVPDVRSSGGVDLTSDT
jgi:hypothetical protein